VCGSEIVGTTGGVGSIDDPEGHHPVLISMLLSTLCQEYVRLVMLPDICDYL